MRVRVATLNAWALPPPLGQDVAFRMRSIGEELRRLDVDVMAFQEVWTAAARALLVEAGRRAGFRESWQPSAWVGGGGLLVLSRWPIERAAFETFDLRGHAERVELGEYVSGKGFVALRIGLPAARLLLVDTHLHARYNHDAPHRYRPHRVAQLSQVVTALVRTADPVILTGDLNFAEGDPEYLVLCGLTGVRDVAAALDHREPTVLNTNPYRPEMVLPSRRIDFVFLRDGATRGLVPRSVRRVFDQSLELDDGPRAYSDHAGVLAELEVGPPTAPAPPPARGRRGAGPLTPRSRTAGAGARPGPDAHSIYLPRREAAAVAVDPASGVREVEPEKDARPPPSGPRSGIVERRSTCVVPLRTR